jgi:hypothetical protein
MVDIPWCAGDLFFIEKCAIVLERPAETPRGGR